MRVTYTSIKSFDCSLAVEKTNFRRIINSLDSICILNLYSRLNVRMIIAESYFEQFSFVIEIIIYKYIYGFYTVDEYYVVGYARWQHSYLFLIYILYIV